MVRRAVTAILLAFALPGAGHVYLGRRARGAAFCAIVCLMFAIGIAVHGKPYSFHRGALLNNVLTIGSMGSGLLYAGARRLGVEGDVKSITFEHGTAFVLTAGLMNLLLVLDVFDISRGRKE